MIPNLHTLTNSPVARTNLIRLKETPQATICRLLAPVSNLYAIDFAIQKFPKNHKESSQDHYIRIHCEVKNRLRKLLNINDREDVKYELHRLENGQHVYFYLSPVDLVNNQTTLPLHTRIENLCQQLVAEEQSLSRLLQGLFSIHLKIVLLEKSSEHFPISPVYFNSTMYLNARLTKPVSKKSGTGVMETFELDVFASNQSELAFTLHKRKFLVEPSNELYLVLDDDRVWFNIDSARVSARRKLDARSSSLDFFRERSGYGDCQAYTYNVVMNAVLDRLYELEIPHTPLTFQATHVVDQFLTDLDKILTNTVLVVNNGVNFSAAQHALFFETLSKQLPGYKLFSIESLKQVSRSHYSGLPTTTSILVLNPVEDDANNSIRQLTDESAEYSDFFDALDTDRNQSGLRWDIYTQLKLDRLKDLLQEKQLPVVLQGLNIDRKMLDALELVQETKTTHPEQYEADLSKPRSHLKSAVALVNSKIRRTKVELWFKESLLSLRYLPVPNLTEGEYTTFFVRKKKNGTCLLGYVALRVKGGILNVTQIGVNEGDLEWLAVEHPVLARLDKLFNNGFYLHEHSTDALLISYNSVRVPRLIGPSQFNVVDLYAYQEKEKALAEQSGKDFTGYTITRSAKAQRNVLPYLISPGRSIHDPLTKSQKMKHHYIYLQPHDHGLYLLISDAQPTNQSMARTNLVENLMIINKKGEPKKVFEHPLTATYLNSFTLDMLSSGDSSKCSIFAKLARLMVEN